jgi:hypothetical protein
MKKLGLIQKVLLVAFAFVFLIPMNAISAPS